MALLEILTYPNPLLKKTCLPVEEITPEIKRLADDMLATMYRAPGIGLAAPQVGRSIRLAVMDVPLSDDQRTGPLVLVNPRIVSREGETGFSEGCLSVPDFRHEVRRAEKVTVEALDREGAPLCLKAEGLLAICLQHELDHLDGRLFIDYLSPLKRALYKKRRQKKRKEEE
jgi:peptide deformylase